MNRVIQNYKSRKVLLELLKRQEFLVDEYEGFTVNEIDTMSREDTLDMFVTTDRNSNDPYRPFCKMYIKYVDTINVNSLEDILTDLFENAEEKYRLRKELDTLTIVSKDELNEKMQNYLVTLFETRRIFVTIIFIKRLQFNVLNHELQPKEISILTSKEKENLIEKYNINNYMTDIPEISRFDPLALALFLKPGDICRLVRDSPVAISTEYYRVCK